MITRRNGTGFCLVLTIGLAFAGQGLELMIPMWTALLAAWDDL